MGSLLQILGGAAEKACLSRLSLVLGRKSCCEVDDLSYCEVDDLSCCDIDDLSCCEVDDLSCCEVDDLSCMGISDKCRRPAK